MWSNGNASLLWLLVRLLVQIRQVVWLLFSSGALPGGYAKLISNLSESQWTVFYSALTVTTQIVDELKKFSKVKPNYPEAHKPKVFHIQDFDPIDPCNNAYIE
jgi:hypothetical protein